MSGSNIIGLKKWEDLVPPIYNGSNNKHANSIIFVDFIKCYCLFTLLM